jgi:glycosyltransferase involved in cell wall biosynthesis
MENISQIRANIRDKSASYPDILVISRSFLPKTGGIEEYIYNRCLQDPERVIVLVAGCGGDKAFDKVQQFPVYRWIIPQYCRRGFLGKILQSFLNTVWSFILAIKLYFRYHYRYIEWSHGYDFPCVLLLSYFLPVRFFIYIHGKDILCTLRNPLLKALFQLTLKRAQGIVCHSFLTRDFLTTHFRYDTPTHVIHPTLRRGKFGVAMSPSYIDKLRDRVRNAYNIAETAIVILSVGHLVKSKGFHTVIENLTPLLTLGLDVHYILCGLGPCESELQSLVRRLRVESRVHFAGYVSDQELAGYYAACDIFATLNLCNTKVGIIDGLGMSYLEAGHFGKPVIASRYSGITEVVRHEENGLLVDPHCGNEILQAFKRLCQNPELREQLGRKGKQLANCRTFHRALYIPESRYSCLLS